LPFIIIIIIIVIIIVVIITLYRELVLTDRLDCSSARKFENEIENWKQNRENSRQ